MHRRVSMLLSSCGCHADLPTTHLQASSVGPSIHPFKPNARTTKRTFRVQSIRVQHHRANCCCVRQNATSRQSSPRTSQRRRKMHVSAWRTLDPKKRAQFQGLCQPTSSRIHDLPVAVAPDTFSGSSVAVWRSCRIPMHMWLPNQDGAD